jgi:ThiF family
VNREEFLAEFGSRTAAYVDGAELDRRAVVVEVDEAAHTASGHLLLASLLNQLARAHRRIVLVGDLDRALLAPDPFGHRDLRGATIGLAREINPYIEIEESPRAPADPLVRIVIGGRREGALCVGCEGWCGTFGSGQIVEGPASGWGAALAASLTAAACFVRMCGRPFELSGSYSLWAGGGAGTEQGPAPGRIDLGRVLQVGAGAVGAALDYWLFVLGATDFEDWLVVDGDLVDASNLNRQLLYRAIDAGHPGGTAASKSKVTGRLIGSSSQEGYWGEDPASVEASYDAILALANERGVRSALQLRQPPILLHATTSANWQAQCHRHIRGVDDCILCRLPGQAAELTCSTGEVVPRSGVDAALPFLSASAGLLLAVELFRLSEGLIADSPVNFTALHFGGSGPVAQKVRYLCGGTCRTWLAPARRRSIAADTRFAHLDPAVSDVEETS